MKLHIGHISLSPCIIYAWQARTNNQQGKAWKVHEQSTDGAFLMESVTGPGGHRLRGDTSLAECFHRPLYQAASGCVLAGSVADAPWLCRCVSGQA